MSRGQIEAITATGRNQNQGYYNEAQNSYTQAQNAEQDYEKQLSQYKAQNPYGEGGQFQKTTNQVLANTSDAGARAAGESLQGEAERTGQNTAGAVSATEKMQQQGTRDLASEEAKANQERIEGGAAYNKGVLGATEFPAQFASEMAGRMAGAGNTALDIGEKAAAWNDPAADIWNEAAALTASHGAEDIEDKGTKQ